jgi:hypothetical protein
MHEGGRHLNLYINILVVNRLKNTTVVGTARILRNQMICSIRDS